MLRLQARLNQTLTQAGVGSVMTCRRRGCPTKRAVPFLTTVVAIALSAGCSWQRAYTSAQGWQRNACYRLVDQTERERCLGNSDMSYDDYRRRTGSGGSSAASPRQ